MRVSYKVAFLSIVFFAQASVASAATGFLTEALSIYPENPKDGDSVVLTAILRNAETENLSGTVVFYDGSILLGKKAIAIEPGTFGTASVTFKVVAGEHVFSANMGSLTKVSTTGISVPFPIPVSKAELPNLYVTKESSAFGAQAIGLKASAQAEPILQKVGQIQDQVVASVPDSLKQNVSSTATSIESWRTSNGESLATATDSAQKKVDAIEKRSAEETKKYGKPTASVRYIDRPGAYIKLFFLAMLAHIYNHPSVFYSIVIVFTFLVIRSLTLKIIAYVRHRRAAARLASMPKVPRV